MLYAHNTLANGSSAVLLIELSGGGIISNGLTISGANGIVRGLVINRFASRGILLLGAGAVNNIISGNFIGTNAAGQTAQPNGSGLLGDGGVVLFSAAANNIIGGSEPASRNVIAGNNGDGVSLWDSVSGSK